MNSGFADRGLTTWLPRRILLPEPIRWLSTVSTLSFVANRRQFSKTKRMSDRQFRIVPYNGNRAYKYYLDGYKVNGKRKRLFFKDEATANRKLAELVHRLISGRHTAVGDFADFQDAGDEHTEIRT